MVVMDKPDNGYRQFLLPLATRDPKVMAAVKACTAAHVAERDPALADDAQRCHATAVQLLVRHSKEVPFCRDTDHSAAAALLVLLVGQMISGGTDFPFLHRMLLSWVQVAGGEDVLRSSGDYTYFLLQQILMYLPLPPAPSCPPPPLSLPPSPQTDRPTDRSIDRWKLTDAGKKAGAVRPAAAGREQRDRNAVRAARLAAELHVRRDNAMPEQRPDPDAGQ